MHSLRYLLLTFICITTAARMAGTQSLPISKREVTAMVEKAAVVAVVTVSYEEKEVRFDLMEILFSSTMIEEKGTIYRVARNEPNDLHRLTTLMIFPRFPPGKEDLIGFPLDGDKLVGAISTLTEVKVMIERKKANRSTAAQRASRVADR
jgi:hypothetical protein